MFNNSLTRTVFCLFLAVSVSTGALCSERDDHIPVPVEQGGTSYATKTRPRAPRHSPTVQIWYEPGVNAVFVISSTDVGLVLAIIENLSTGTLYTYSFDSSTPAILPVSGESGVWRVILRPIRGTTVTYEFTSDMG